MERQHFLMRNRRYKIWQLFHNRSIDEVISDLLIIRGDPGDHSKVVMWDSYAQDRYIDIKFYQLESDSQFEKRKAEEERKLQAAKRAEAVRIATEIGERAVTGLLESDNSLEKFEYQEYERLKKKFEQDYNRFFGGQ